MQLVAMVEKFPENAHLSVSLLEEKASLPIAQKVLGHLAGDYSGLSDLKETVEPLNLSKEIIRELTGMDKYDDGKLVIIWNNHSKDYSLALSRPNRNCYYPLAVVRINRES